MQLNTCCVIMTLQHWICICNKWTSRQMWWKNCKELIWKAPVLYIGALRVYCCYIFCL